MLCTLVVVQFSMTDRSRRLIEATRLLYHNFAALSRGFLNFFQSFFSCSSALLSPPLSRQPHYYTTPLPFCQHLFSKIFTFCSLSSKCMHLRCDITRLSVNYTHSHTVQPVFSVLAYPTQSPKSPYNLKRHWYSIAYSSLQNHRDIRQSSVR